MKNLIWKRSICNRRIIKGLVGILMSVCCFADYSNAQATYKVLSWNNLGMHCMDNDYSVFSILPPYNTIHAQIVRGNGGTASLIATGSGYSVLYQSVTDPSGSINTTSEGKSNFWTYSPLLLGATLPVDAGVPLPGYGQAFMPGTNNIPQAMNYESDFAWFAAYGIPITPYDNLLRKNTYPLMRITAKNGSSTIASTDIVLPVSDEMDCRVCHASGSGPAARPPQGWVWRPNPTVDYRLNILRMHDTVRFDEMPTEYRTYLTTAGFTTNGLYASVIEYGKPVFCASCHLSEAVPGTGLSGVPPLTEAVHGLHKSVIDPLNGLTLEAINNRQSCYRCHPGSETRCLRGAMGAAVAANGELAMQCQSCHGSMSTVASPNRIGWLNEPNCQACHTGDDVSNNGQIRYTSVFISNDVMRVAVNRRFATNADTPAESLDLYRFSSGHGGLQCSACHGSTHAIFPTAHVNDNITATQFQGHEGTLSECSSCHKGTPNTVSGGPHGMHPIGAVWVEGHKTPGKIEANCITCHGSDERGTVLSRSQKNQTISAKEQTFNFWKGFQIGCYTCHMGANSDDQNYNPIPAAQNINRSTTINTPVTFTLPATDNDPLSFRIVKQPLHGRVGVSGSTATYYPDNAFAGVDTFTFAAWDGMRNSNLGIGTITVSGGACAYALIPSSQSFSELSQVGTLQVSTGSSCDWLAASDAYWLSILTPGSQVTGAGGVSYSLTRNFSSNARTGTLSVAGLTFTVTQAGAPPDDNGDGLPDSWQETYFTLATNPDAAPGQDPDLDGKTNMDEYLSGTIPSNTGSFLRITSFDVDPTGPLFQLSFPSVIQRYYQVQRSTDLKQPQWQGFTNAVIGTGTDLPQAGPYNPSDKSMFYRVQMVD